MTFAADPVAEYHRQNSGLVGPAGSLPGRATTFVEDVVNHDETKLAQERERNDKVENDAPAGPSEPLHTISEVPARTAEASQSSAAGTTAGTSGHSNADGKSPKDISTSNTQSISDSTESGDALDGSQGRHRQKGKASRLHPPNVHWSDNNSGSNTNNTHSDPSTSESDVGSREPLLQSRPNSRAKSDPDNESTPSLVQQEPQAEEDDNEELAPSGGFNFLADRLSKLNLDDNIYNKKQRLKARISRYNGENTSDRQRRRFLLEGEIVKAQCMLVRVEEAVQKLPEDYAEKDSMRVEARPIVKWREYLVVCRRSYEDDSSFLLQMYRTHVIPAIHKQGSTRPSHHEILLDRRETGVNLYSSLDKTIAIWHPSRYGSRIYIMRGKSAADSVEWYTFFLQALGWRLPTSLQIYSPDFDVSLMFRDPFKQLMAVSQSSQERVAATAIVRGCMKTLEAHSEWANVLNIWSRSEKMGLAWKRYDRLEWVYGLNEEKMLGMAGMHKSHDLEIRPRYHYPTTVKHGTNGSKEEEPPPVEGFLVRLTSQRGSQQWMNKMFYKRLYFFTQDHYFLFCRPPKAMPPSPPRHVSRTGPDIPSSEEILNAMPLSYDVKPFPVEDDDVTWLSNGNGEYVKRHDEEAYAEAQRNVHNLTQADGYMDLCQIQEVRHVQRGSSPADANIREGEDVDFHRQEDFSTSRDDGATDQFSDARTFELVLTSGLVVRLQSYSASTKEEWMNRLKALVTYWKKRTAADAAENKSIKKHNLETLDIDEELESIMGQFAKKWELKKAEASPYLHNMCALTGCRTIRVSSFFFFFFFFLVLADGKWSKKQMSGQVYLKPSRRSTFSRYTVMLTAGKLLIFRTSLRTRTGVEVPHIHHTLKTTIDLRDCYVYSGLLTEGDLLYGERTFDSSHPGHHSLPRFYLSDKYTSHDEDTAVTFVIWQPVQKNLFLAEDSVSQDQEQGGRTQQKTVRPVPTLGVPGRTQVYKARSRVEKDRWVMSIAAEIDRLQEERQEDIRIVT